MLCQSTFSCNASVNGSSIDTWTDRHAIICCIGNRLADWHSIGRMTLYWQFEVGLAKVAKCAIGTGLAPDWPIGTRLDWIGSDWQIGKYLSQRKIDPILAPDWHRIGMDWHGLARIGKLDYFCPKEKLAPDWHRIGNGFAWIGTDWHGLAN